MQMILQRIYFFYNQIHDIILVKKRTEDIYNKKRQASNRKSKEKWSVNLNVLLGVLLMDACIPL